MPSALKNFASNQKYGMSKIVGPQDAAGAILGNVVANHFFDEDEENDLGWNDSPSHTRPHMPTGQSVGDWINFRL